MHMRIFVFLNRFLLEHIAVLVLQRCRNLFIALQVTTTARMPSPLRLVPSLASGLCLMSEATALGIVQQLATLGKGTAQVVHVKVFVDLIATPPWLPSRNGRVSGSHSV